MKADLEKAKNILLKSKYTCVFCKDSIIITSFKRGINPLLDFLDSGVELSNFSCADKIVGKAAAFIYVLMGIKYVYAKVISESAKNILTRNGIQVDCNKTTKAILNRAHTGLCPMEQSVLDIDNSELALIAIRKRLSQLKNQ